MENLEQGSSAWHQWRSQGIGASEAPIIMGESPYQTPLMLWEVKTKRRPPQETNWAMQRGTNMEPKARAEFELKHNVEMIPTLAEHATYPFIRASLDGYNKSKNSALEIKCCGKKNFELVKSGLVPLDYKAQIQQQILTTGVDKIYLWAFDGENGVSLEVYPDIEYCQTLLDKLIEFWKYIQTDTPPPADPKRDYEVIKDDALEVYVQQWKMLQDEFKEINQEIDALEEKIRSGLQIPRGLINGVRLTKTQRKGNIQYKNVKELEGVDLETYRGKPSEVFSIKLL